LPSTFDEISYCHRPWPLVRKHSEFSIHAEPLPVCTQIFERGIETPVVDDEFFVCTLLVAKSEIVVQVPRVVVSDDKLLQRHCQQRVHQLSHFTIPPIEQSIEKTHQSPLKFDKR